MKEHNGHSLIEMLVVLIIVGVLIAAVVPAVQRVRESTRQAQCIHNQSQLAKAVHMFVAAEPQGRFPGFRAVANNATIGWAPQIFAYLGRKDLPLDAAQATYIEALVCPSDQGPRDAPRLNYVVNGGQLGTDSTADGVFYDHTKPANERVYITKEDFRDGLTNTILLAENLDATVWTVTDEANQCILWPLSAGNEINGGAGARPSSHHPGGFVAAFADGTAKFISETDLNGDAAIATRNSRYAALLTPGDDDPAANDDDNTDEASTPLVSACGETAPKGFQQGLRGEYWNVHSSNPNAFTTPPLATRVDSTISFPYGIYDAGYGNVITDSYNGGALNYPVNLPVISGQHYSGQWTGEFRADATGSYQFWLKWDDGTQVIINNVTIHDALGESYQCYTCAPEKKGSVFSLEAGKWYCLEIKHGNHSGPGWLQLLWQPPGAPGPVIIPAANLRSIVP